MRTLRTEGDDDSYIQKDELTARLIEKYNLLEKDYSDLESRLEKQRIAAETEINLEKKQHEKAVLELARIKHENRELHRQVQHLENKLQAKEREADDLKSRLEMKNALDQKHQQRDAQLFQSFIGKSPTSSNAYDAKVMSLIQVFQDSNERLEEESQRLRKELEKLRSEKAVKIEESTFGRREEGYSSEKQSKELSQKVSLLEEENRRLGEDNREMAEKLEKVEQEKNGMKEENLDWRKKYDDLKNRYYAIDLGTPNKGEPKFGGGGGESTPYSNHLKAPKSFSTSKKPDIKGLERGQKDRQYQEGEIDLSPNETKKLLWEIVEIYNLKSPSQIIQSIKKTEKVMQMIPKLQKLLSEIAALVFSRAELQGTEPQIELIIPCLKNWLANLDETEELRKLKATLVEKIGLVKDSGNADIIKSIDDLLYLSFQHENLRLKMQKDNNTSGEQKLIVEQLTKILGAKPTVTLMKQMSVQLNDLRHFITLVKNKLELDPNMSNEACLTHLLKYMEGAKKDEEVVTRLLHLLECSNTEYLLRQVEEMVNGRRNPMSYAYRKPY